MTSGPATDSPIEDLLRDLAPQVLGALVRRHRDFSAAEDATQEALVAAAARWPEAGRPEHPRAWLIQVATRRFIDQQRRDDARRRREQLVASRAPAEDPPDPPDQDDTLLLMFLCCPPWLTPGSAIPLTLRAVGGLTTREIAAAFLVPEATMAQRISRAKATVKASGAAILVPPAEEVPERLRSVLHVLYLLFNEGYATSTGPDLMRTDLAGEAIRLTRAVRAARPDDPEVAGLLALMLLTDARRPARTDPAGELIALADQDRRLWDQGLIAEGLILVTEALGHGAVGEYQLQAAIAGLHDEAARPADTDWPQILALYGLLVAMTPNPMVRLNQAVAAAMVDGPEVGLARLADLDGPLADHPRLHTVRAHLLERAGRPVEAVAEFRLAAAHTPNRREQEYLTLQAARLRGDPAD